MILPFSVFIYNPRNEGAPVWIVLQCLNTARNIKLLLVEIYHSVCLLYPRALVADGNATPIIPPGMLFHTLKGGFHRRYLTQTRVLYGCHIAPALRISFVLFH